MKVVQWIKMTCNDCCIVRFTEIYVSDMNDPSDLKQLVLEYLQAFTLTAKQLNSIVS